MKRISVVVDDYLMEKLNNEANRKHKMFSEVVRDILRDEFRLFTSSETPSVIPTTPSKETSGVIQQIILKSTPKKTPKYPTGRCRSIPL